MTRWEEIARAQAGADYAVTYAERFRTNAAHGHDIHGEARLIQALIPAKNPVTEAPTSVLDAGCGTGRIGIKLAEWGYDVVGVDIDQTMLAIAEAEAPHVPWHAADLATFDFGRTFDVVLLAGNIVPLLEPGTLSAVARRLAAHTARTPAGFVVVGFGLDAAHLPGGCPVTPLGAYDAAMRAAGMVMTERWSGWDQSDLAADPGYAVSIHRRTSEAERSLSAG